MQFYHLLGENNIRIYLELYDVIVVLKKTYNENCLGLVIIISSVYEDVYVFDWISRKCLGCLARFVATVWLVLCTSMEMN